IVQAVWYSSQQVDKNCAFEFENKDELLNTRIHQKITPKHNTPKQNQKSPQRTLMTKFYNIPSCSDESDGIDCSDSNYNNKLNELVSQNIENINLSSIQDPIVHAKKGAPHKNWFKVSQEIEQKNTKH
ncbi:37296_t:CDS:2, partial [Gigaspora margarita]